MMSSEKPNPHWIFWLAVLLGLLWNTVGILNYMAQMNPEKVAAMPEAYRAIIEDRPSWATVGFAVGVFAGTMGCLLLLLKKALAGFVFMISLIGIFVTMIHSMNVVVSSGNLSLSMIFQTIILPIVIANLLIGLTIYAMKKDWFVVKK